MKQMRFFRMSLLELIVAIGLLAFISSLTSVVIYGVSREWQSVQNKARVLSECQAIDRIAESAFRNAIPFHWSTENEQDSQILLFQGTGYDLYFVYRHPAVGDPLTALRYMYIFQDGDKVIARYRNTPMFPTDVRTESRETQTEIIASGVRNLSFMYAYRDPQNGAVSWTPNWDTDEEENIPIAINMFIRWENDVQHAWLRRTAGNGFAEAYDIRKDENEQEMGPVILNSQKSGNNNTGSSGSISNERGSTR